MQVEAMEQGRQRMLQKWAEPSWGDRQNLVQEMAAAARMTSNGPVSGGQGHSAPGEGLQHHPQIPLSSGP